MVDLLLEFCDDDPLLLQLIFSTEVVVLMFSLTLCGVPQLPLQSLKLLLQRLDRVLLLIEGRFIQIAFLNEVSYELFGPSLLLNIGGLPTDIHELSVLLYSKLEPGFLVYKEIDRLTEVIA